MLFGSDCINFAILTLASLVQLPCHSQIALESISIGYTTRWRCISDLFTEGQRPERNKSLNYTLTTSCITGFYHAMPTVMNAIRYEGLSAYPFTVDAYIREGYHTTQKYGNNLTIYMLQWYSYPHTHTHTHSRDGGRKEDMFAFWCGDGVPR